MYTEFSVRDAQNDRKQKSRPAGEHKRITFIYVNTYLFTFIALVFLLFFLHILINICTDV